MSFTIAPTFVDANILIYRVDAGAPEKQRLATEWLDTLWKLRTGRLSQQVLNEFYHCATRKLRHPVDRERAQAMVKTYAAWKPLPVDGRLVERSFLVEKKFGFSFWDSLIVAAAQTARCNFLLTEDLQHGQDLDGVQVMNPFIDPPRSSQPSLLHDDSIGWGSESR
jgi:predicted nucleic acid-binding protein